MWKLTAGAALAAALLAGCGGGGDSSPSAPAAPASTNVEAAVRALVRSSHSYALQGSASTGASLTGGLSTAPGGTLSHQSLNFDSTSLTLSVSSGGALLSSTTLVLWHYPGTVNLRFSTDSADGTCNNYTATSALPTAAALGTSGAYFTATQYPGCTSPSTAGPFSFGTVTGTWSYSLVGGVPFVCINSSNQYPGIASSSTLAICAEVVDGNGSLGAHARIVSKDLNGNTVTLAN
jgi:hypothetical protein